MTTFEDLVEQIMTLAEGIRMDLDDGEPPEQLAAAAAALYSRDPGHAARLLGASLVVIAQRMEADRD